jgi:hypothetical protein
MNAYVLQIRNRLPVTLRSRLGTAYYRVASFIAVLPVIAGDMRVMVSHLSADVVPLHYWRRMKRFLGASL